MSDAAEEDDHNLSWFLDQLTGIRKLGGIRAVAGELPLPSGMDIPDNLTDIEHEFRRVEGALRSMTSDERSNPDLLFEETRRQRVASGSGLTLAELNRLIADFYKIRSSLRSMDLSDILGQTLGNLEDN
jgi:signal recognition particle subunit SRP54